ncbi:uncharacterized protein [Magallana gigas]|uniref:uncharacterized protein isoform X2 n=1 Tax=Magallana gigas TaxID=29159 RepID=UPI00148A86D2|nr:uncharacterized protein LOC117683029 isoform X2 [Crassostrea gigas]
MHIVFDLNHVSISHFCATESIYSLQLSNYRDNCSKSLPIKPTTTILQTTTTIPQITTSTQITTSAAITKTQITKSATTPQITPTPSQITTTQIPTTTQMTTQITTTKPATSSEYPQPAKEKSGLCLDNQASSPGPIIGAVIGGTIFGSILTAVVFVYINRRSKNSYNSKDDQTKTVRNAAYGYTNDNDQLNTMTVSVNSAYTEINDRMRKSAAISPITRQADSSKTDDVYNHLHETEKEDRSDFYDHAGPAPSLSVMEDGYGVLSMESEGNDNYNTVGRNYTINHGKPISAENKQNDDYFILETQND